MHRALPGLACLIGALVLASVAPSSAQPGPPRAPVAPRLATPAAPSATGASEEGEAVATTRPERQWSHIAAAAGDDCRETLKATGAKFRAVLDAKKPNARGCGVPRGVVVTRGPSGIVYSPPLHIDCSLALKLVDIESVLQEEAQAHLGGPVVRAATLGSYACRGVIGRLRGWTGGISEHSFGNAFDVARVDTKNGKRASVMRSLRPGEAPTTPEGVFLARAARRIRREAGVRVLGPDFDASHRDHLHIDAGSPWWR
jgi:hypothetical protein